MQDNSNQAATMLTNMFRQFATTGSCRQGTITEVDKDTNTCTVEVETTEGQTIQFSDVPLRVLSIESNFIVYPAIGSDCYIGFYGGSTNSPVVIGFQNAESVAISGQTDISLDSEQITLNGGENGGLINIQDLTSKLNELVNAFNNHTHQITGVQPGSGSVTAPPVMSPASTFTASDYEDTTVTH